MLKKLYKTICLVCCLGISMPIYALSFEKHLKEMQIDEKNKAILLYMDDNFGKQRLTTKDIKKIYKSTTKDVHKALPKNYKDFEVRIYVNGIALESITEDLAQTTPVKENSTKKKRKGWWGDVSWTGKPWVTNVSIPHSVINGLQGKHLSVWASHGCFYDKAKGKWRWQRPNMFCTNEDLFTQTIVVPYLIPMLEKAGANVFTPRERDWQVNEVIVDNDDVNVVGYKEILSTGKWKNASLCGFAMPKGVIDDNYNPFEQGTVRQAATTNKDNPTIAIYQPTIPESGRYAVYVSYASLANSIDDAHYTVYHQGQRTEFRVNQKMGGGTWVYLGTFEFDKGNNDYNRVEVSTLSSSKGVVTTDAVRFGGGMGNVSRGGMISGMPRCLEGARYYAQWAGVPYSIYSLYQGEDDYKDDINCRSLMTNWIAGGSPYVPTKEGKAVPIDLCLAVHSDAGYDNDMKSIYGSLAICTTDFNDGKLYAGVSRSHSKDFCEMLLQQSKKDIVSKYGDWKWRDLYDRNYSETRLPAMPSAIFETLSHQSFPDMKLGHDPEFKFTLARSIYKTILRYEAKAHGEKVVVAPLAPVNFSVTLDKQGNAVLNWTAQKDKEESTAYPRSYNVYMAMGGFDYDNGRNIEKSHFVQHLEKDLLYRFRVSAVNGGGESFPTEELCVVWHGPEAKNILVVNGFQRLSGPTVIDTYDEKGFDINDDPGLSYGVTAGWLGAQQVYSTQTAGKEGRGTFAYSGEELAGRFVAGNSFNYVAEHTLAALSANKYNVSSCSKDVVELGDVTLNDYDVVDLLVGNEKYVESTHTVYRAFPKQLQKQLNAYCQSRCGALLVSGSYLCSDMRTEEENNFLKDVLNIQGGGTIRGANYLVIGLQQTSLLTNTTNPYHYATVQSDVLKPVGNDAFVAMQYSDGQTAAVACPLNTKTFVMGFPFECIKNSAQRASVMRGILDFLIR